MPAPDFPLLLGAASLIGGMTGLTFVARRWPPRRPPTGAHRADRRPRPVSFGAVPDGAVWRPCATTACEQLTTRHTPDTDGGRRCTGCGHLTLPPFDEGAHADA